jgi:hypothetical protein
MSTTARVEFTVSPTLGEESAKTNTTCLVREEETNGTMIVPFQATYNGINPIKRLHLSKRLAWR